MRQEVERTSVIMYYPQEEHHCPSTPGGEREKVRGWGCAGVRKRGCGETGS